MIDKMKSMFTQEVRGWIYRVLIAVGAVLVTYGVLSADELAVWLGVVVAMLNVMPSVNTSVKKDSAVSAINVPDES
jgi:hypothetical protein